MQLDDVVNGVCTGEPRARAHHPHTNSMVNDRSVTSEERYHDKTSEDGYHGTCFCSSVSLYTVSVARSFFSVGRTYSCRRLLEVECRDARKAQRSLGVRTQPRPQHPYLSCDFASLSLRAYSTRAGPSLYACRTLISSAMSPSNNIK